MAPNYRYFWIALSAIFILISVSAVAEQNVEGHRCHWCGPLAEQVHRSQRASSCDGDISSKVTVCDEGLPYCAIVATSPPYVESRFCVKVYQDECYTVYCNSTKTWKITCPCRGELCNGKNTKRETEAFQALLKNNIAKLTQDKRLKRALISNAGFIGMTMKKNKIDNVTEEMKDIENDANANIVTDDTNAILNNETQLNNTELEEPEVTTESYKIKKKEEATSHNNFETRKKGENDKSDGKDYSNAVANSNESSDTSEGETSNDESSETESETESASSESNENTFVKVKPIASNTINNDLKQIDIPSGHIDSDDLKTEIIVLSSQAPRNTNLTVNNAPELTTAIPPMMKTTQSEPKKLPTPEALQHNETPTTKTIERITTSTHFDVTTLATPRNNTAVRVDAHIITLVIGVILNF